MRLTILTRWIIVLTLIGLIYDLQITYDHTRLQTLTALDVPINELIEPAIPNSQTVDKASFGLQNTIADVLWLQVIQYYGGGDPKGKYRQLPRLIKTISALDPRFTYPYSFAGLVLPNEGYTDEAIAILKEAEKTLPNEWEIPYNIGTIYFINKKDSVSAAKYYEIAAGRPNAPANTEFLSAVQHDRSKDRQTAQKIFQKLADSSENEYFKNRAQAFIEHYQLLDALEGLVKIFHAKEGRLPKSLDELVQKRYVSEIPADPVNRKIEYDPSTGLITDATFK